MTSRCLTAALVCLLNLSGCAASSSRVTDYLTGLQPPPADSQQIGLPLIAGLLVALPEDERAKPTAPSQAELERLAARMQKELHGSPKIMITKIVPPITLPAGGLGGLSLGQLQGLAREEGLTKMIVVVASSRSASKIRFTTVLETQLYARMDAALVDLSTGRVLMSESGQDDYVLAETLYYSGYTYPRLYYRTFTFASPFTVVEGPPHKALGEAAFRGAADQLSMNLRQRLAPSS